MDGSRQELIPPVLRQLPGGGRGLEELALSLAGRRPPHAVLLLGPPGAPKEEAALALACVAFCPSGGCGACSTCRRVLAGTHPDLHLVSPEGGQILVDSIRSLRQAVSLAPLEAPLHAAVVEEAERMNEAAQGGILKVLEEPPEPTLFLLLSRSPEEVGETVASRCWRVAVLPPPREELALHLAAETGREPAEAARVLEAVGGNPRLARLGLERGVLEFVKGWRLLDTWGALQAAAEVAAAAKEEGRRAALAFREEKERLKAALEGSPGLPAALKRLEKREKRAVARAERDLAQLYLSAAARAVAEDLPKNPRRTLQALGSLEAAAEKLQGQGDLTLVLEEAFLGLVQGIPG